MKLAVKRLMSYVATPVPVGLTEYKAWVASILELAGPLADQESMEWVVAQQLTNTKPDAARVPKALFVNTLRNAAAKQLAVYEFQNIKQRRDDKAAEAAKAAQEQQTAQETTAASEQT